MLSVALLEPLVTMVAEEESEHWENADHNREFGDDPFESTRDVLIAWANANLRTASDEEHFQFCSLLAGLEDKDKIIPCSVAMDWAADAFEAGNVSHVEAAKRGMRIVRALSASY